MRWNPRPSRPHAFPPTCLLASLSVLFMKMPQISHTSIVRSGAVSALCRRSCCDCTSCACCASAMDTSTSPASPASWLCRRRSWECGKGEKENTVESVRMACCPRASVQLVG